MNKVKYYLLRYLLRWYISKIMDQWERWQIDTKKGKAFIEISWKKDKYKYDQI